MARETGWLAPVRKRGRLRPAGYWESMDKDRVSNHLLLLDPMGFGEVRQEADALAATSSCYA